MRFFTGLTIGGWQVAPEVGEYVYNVYKALLEEERLIYAQRLRQAFTLAEKASNFAAQMSREEALVAIKAGCKANKSLGWTAEEGLLDPTGWYEASLKMFDSDDIIGVYIVSHSPFDEVACSGWQELVPSGLGCEYYGRSSFDPSEPSEGLAIFTRMVAGLLAIAPNGDAVHINMDDDNAYYIKVGNAVEAEISQLSDRELAEAWFDDSVELIENLCGSKVSYRVGGVINDILNKTYSAKCTRKMYFAEYIYRVARREAAKRDGFYSDGSPRLESVYAEFFGKIIDALAPRITEKFNSLYEADYKANRAYWEDDRIPYSHDMASDQLWSDARSLVAHSDEANEIIENHRPAEVPVYDWYKAVWEHYDK